MIRNKFIVVINIILLNGYLGDRYGIHDTLILNDCMSNFCEICCNDELV